MEVLRGRKGTLYGASSMGMTEILITNAPVAKGFAASVLTIQSETSGGSYSFALNLPEEREPWAVSCKVGGFFYA